LFEAKVGSVAGERRKHNHEGHEGSRSFDWAMVPSGVVGCWVGEDRQRELLLMRGVPFTLSALPFKIEDKADVAQLVEQPIRNRQVSGSSPLVGSRFYTGSKHFETWSPLFYPITLSHKSLTCRFLFKPSRALRERHVVYIPSAALIRTLFVASLACVVEVQ
jgi:hypothetical protein